MTHTHTHTFGRIPLEEGSARRRDVYLQETQHSQETDFMLLTRFEPAIPASDRSQTHALDRAATGIEKLCFICTNNLITQVPILSLSLSLLVLNIVTVMYIKNQRDATWQYVY